MSFFSGDNFGVIASIFKGKGSNGSKIDTPNKILHKTSKVISRASCGVASEHNYLVVLWCGSL